MSFLLLFNLPGKILILVEENKNDESSSYHEV